MGDWPRSAAIPPRVELGGALGAAFELDLRGEAHVCLVGELTADLTLTLVNMVPGSQASLRLAQDVTGGRALTVAFGGDSYAVDIPDAAGEVAVLVAFYDGADLFLSGMQGPPGEAGPDDSIRGHPIPAPGSGDDEATLDFDFDTLAFVWRRKRNWTVAADVSVMRKNAVQPVAAGSHVLVTWETIVEDGLGAADPANDRFVIPAGGDAWYLVEFVESWDASSSGTRLSRILLNGASMIGGAQRTAGAESTMVSRFEGRLAAGDLLTCWTIQSSGASRNLTAVAGAFGAACEFRIRKVGV